MSDAVINVDREVDKVLSKFGQLSAHSGKTLTDLVTMLQTFQRDLVMLSSKLDME